MMYASHLQKFILLSLERVTKSVVVVERFRFSRRKKPLPGAGDENRKLTTLNGGSLGSWVDEGRCKMRADM
jgi:hypothetical protein